MASPSKKKSSNNSNFSKTMRRINPILIMTETTVSSVNRNKKEHIIDSYRMNSMKTPLYTNTWFLIVMKIMVIIQTLYPLTKEALINLVGSLSSIIINLSSSMSVPCFKVMNPKALGLSTFNYFSICKIKRA